MHLEGSPRCMHGDINLLHPSSPVLGRALHSLPIGGISVGQGLDTSQVYSVGKGFRYSRSLECVSAWGRVVGSRLSGPFGPIDDLRARASFIFSWL